MIHEQDFIKLTSKPFALILMVWAFLVISSNIGYSQTYDELGIQYAKSLKKQNKQDEVSTQSLIEVGKVAADVISWFMETRLIERIGIGSSDCKKREKELCEQAVTDYWKDVNIIRRSRGLDTLKIDY